MTSFEFEIFKDNMKHRLKTSQLNFIENELRNKSIDYFLDSRNLLCALYTLAMIDYISRVNSIPLYNKYDSLRKVKFKEIVYPVSILTYAMIHDKPKEEILAYYKSRYNLAPIPEFLRHNIIEGDILNE